MGRTLILLGFMLVVNSMGTGATSLIRPEITQNTHFRGPVSKPWRPVVA